MSVRRFLLLLAAILGACLSLQAEGNTPRVSLCSIQENPEGFLHVRIDLQAQIFVGNEIGQIKEGKCSFRFAVGDDYQTFGHRFRVKHDAQWALMMKLLGAPLDCRMNARIIKARIRGTVIRVPATGTIPENEMPLEIVIQSVAEVEHVPIKCSTSDAHSTDTLLHESGHADPPKPQ